MPSGAKATTATVIPTLRYADAAEAIDWLCRAFGFETHLVATGENGTITYAQLTFGNGMIMLGSARDDDYGRMIKQPSDIGGAETQAPYVIVDDVDAHLHPSQSRRRHDRPGTGRPVVRRPALYLPRPGRPPVELRNVRSMGMTRRALLGLTALSVGLLACSQEPRALTTAEQELLREVGFDHPTVVAGIAAVGGPVQRLMALSDGGEAVPAPGVTVELSEDRVSRELARLRDVLGPLGFGVYRAEQNFGFEPDRLAIVSGTDPYEFLRIVRIDGINYDLEHEAVVAKLREWDRRYGLDYLGAGLDWVNARFNTLPSDMAAFAQEVYAFCPDVVDQGTETVERLADEMRRSGSLYCWWD